jgi:hypothetical protein
MEAFVQSTLQNCFSIVVAAFLLLRMERELRFLREAIDRLRYCQICRFAPVVPADVLDAKFAEPQFERKEADAS